WPLQFGGGGPAIANLLDSNTMAYAGDPSVVGEHILGGQLKGLCVTDTQRWASLPNSRPAVRPASTSCSTSGPAWSFPKARRVIVLRRVARASASWSRMRAFCG